MAKSLSNRFRLLGNLNLPHGLLKDSLFALYVPLCVIWETAADFLFFCRNEISRIYDSLVHTTSLKATATRLSHRLSRVWERPSLLFKDRFVNFLLVLEFMKRLVNSHLHGLEVTLVHMHTLRDWALLDVLLSFLSVLNDGRAAGLMRGRLRASADLVRRATERNELIVSFKGICSWCVFKAKAQEI